MLEEIRQQPDALERTLRGGIRGLERFRKVLARRPPKLVVLVARGTSDNAALFGRYLLEITTGIHLTHRTAQIRQETASIPVRPGGLASN